MFNKLVFDRRDRSLLNFSNDRPVLVRYLMMENGSCLYIFVNLINGLRPVCTMDLQYYTTVINFIRGPSQIFLVKFLCSFSSVEFLCSISSVHSFCVASVLFMVSVQHQFCSWFLCSISSVHGFCVASVLFMVSVQHQFCSLFLYSISSVYGFCVASVLFSF